MNTGNLFLRFKFLFCLLLFYISCLPTVSLAQLIGKYEFTGVSTKETQNNFSEVTTQPYFATFSPFKREVVQWWRGDNVYNSREWGKLVTEERFIEFTITAKPDYAIQITSLSFDNYRTEEGPTNIRIAHNGSGNFTSVFHEYSPSVGSITKTTWDFDDVLIEPGKPLTFRIYGHGANSYLGAFRVDNVSLFGNAIPQVKVNEFHYVNTATTKTGFIEVAVPKYFTNLNSVQIGLYNNAGAVYGTYSLSNFKTIDTGNDAPDKLYYLDIPAGLAEQQGGICLYAGNYVMQFLSYGGQITANTGPASGLKSQDINITESITDGPDNSLYLALNGNANFAPGSWGKGFDNSNTKGHPNVDNSVLPVELIYFKAHAESKEVSLSWATASEKDNDYFVVERSQSEIANFLPLATIKGNGTTTAEKQYKFVDRKPVDGISYYRLKQVDFDGKVTYSPLLAVKIKELNNFISLYPNPVSSYLNLDFGRNNQAVQLQIVNTVGKVMYQSLEQKTQIGTFTILVESLPAGTYYLIVLEEGIKESRIFVKQ